MKTVLRTRALDWCPSCKITVVGVLKNTVHGDVVRFCPACHEPLGVSGEQAERARKAIREAMGHR
jgi:hypothetical protein